jgi:hypothetical protein
MTSQDQHAPFVLDKLTEAIKQILTCPDDFDIEVIGRWCLNFIPKSNDVKFGVDLAALEECFDGEVALFPFEGPAEDQSPQYLGVIGMVEGIAVQVRIFYTKDSA